MTITPYTMDVWHGIVFMRVGPYKGAVFKFTLALEDYPLKKPKVTFVTRVFHPDVMVETGVFHETLEWVAQKSRVWHLLDHLHRALVSPSSDSSERAANEDASTTLRDNPDLFMTLASNNAKESSAQVKAILAGQLQSPPGQFELAPLKKP